jgi:hypothetical protein
MSHHPPAITGQQGEIVFVAQECVEAEISQVVSFQKSKWPDDWPKAITDDILKSYTHYCLGQRVPNGVLTGKVTHLDHRIV